MASKKIKESDKINYLDHIEYEALQTPGAGMYNPRVVIFLFRNEFKRSGIN